MSGFDPAAQIASRVNEMRESAILRMARLTRELRARGADIVALTLGEPDFDTPEIIRRAACIALEDGYTHYPPVPGLPELREAIAEKLRRDNGLDYGQQGVLVTAGAKQALANAILALVNPGDEVILPAPYWNAYDILVELAGGVPVVVPGDAARGFQPDVAHIAERVTDRSRLIILNTPCNPSGAVFSREVLASLAEIVRAHPRLMIISDEIYEHILYDGARHVSIGSLPGMLERTITINGFSKAYAMTGWRLGYAAAVPELCVAMTKLQGAFTAGVNAFSQKAAVTALKEGAAEVERMRREYERRRALMLRLLQEVPGISLQAPAGAFYMLPDVSALLANAAGGLPRDDLALAEWLLLEHGVATVPGSAFAAPGTLRLSFATSEDNIRKGVSRLREGLQRLAQMLPQGA